MTSIFGWRSGGAYSPILLELPRYNLVNQVVTVKHFWHPGILIFWWWGFSLFYQGVIPNTYFCQARPGPGPRYIIIYYLLFIIYYLLFIFYFAINKHGLFFIFLSFFLSFYFSFFPFFYFSIFLSFYLIYYYCIIIKLISIKR